MNKFIKNTDNFWINEPGILINKICQFNPFVNYTFNNNLNAYTRLIIIITIVLFSITKSFYYIFIGIVLIIIIIIIYYMSSRTDNFKNISNNNNPQNNNPQNNNPQNNNPQNNNPQNTIKFKTMSEKMFEYTMNKDIVHDYNQLHNLNAPDTIKFAEYLRENTPKRST